MSSDDRRFVGIREDGRAEVTSNPVRDERGFIRAIECSGEDEAKRTRDAINILRVTYRED